MHAHAFPDRLIDPGAATERQYSHARIIGASTACPVGAGCAAALRTKLPPGTIPPAKLFAQLRSTAMLDPLSAAQSLGL